MPDLSVRRRLAAIMAADLVGYSRLIAADETGTRARFNTCLDRLIAPRIAEHHGRLVKTMGDGLLVEFSSAIDAVRAACAIQNSVAADQETLADPQKLAFRIGINLGDVIVEGSDIHGDGVNVAARLEGIAAPGGIVISGVVHDIVRTKVPYAFDDLGPQKVKNVAERIRAFRVMDAAADAGASPDQSLPAYPAASRPAPETPSVAVLPFGNAGGNPEGDYFAEGISEDLITDLSKIKGLHVAARHSSFAFKGSPVPLPDVAAALGVRHVLSGTMRRAGERVRINAELVDTEGGAPLWAERFDGDTGDIFALQDEINARIVSSLKLHLVDAAKPGALRAATRSPEAYEQCLKGRAEYTRYTPANLARAMACFQAAIDLDPAYAEAYAYLAYCRTSAHVFAWPGSDTTLEPALALAERSIALDARAPLAHTRLGWVLGFLGKEDAAVAAFERAIALDARCSEAFLAYGETMNRLMQPARALPLLERAFSIDTKTPPAWEFTRGHSFVLLRRYEDAVEEIEPVISRLPSFVPGRVQLTRAYQGLERFEDAAACINGLREAAPKYRIANARRMFPYPVAAERDNLVDALRRAGLPE